MRRHCFARRAARDAATTAAIALARIVTYTSSTLRSPPHAMPHSTSAGITSHPAPLARA